MSERRASGARAAIAALIMLLTLACGEQSEQQWLREGGTTPAPERQPIAWLRDTSVIFFYQDAWRIARDARKIGCKTSGIYALRRDGDHPLATGRPACDLVDALYVGLLPQRRKITYQRSGVLQTLSWKDGRHDTIPDSQFTYWSATSLPCSGRILLVGAADVRDTGDHRALLLTKDSLTGSAHVVSVLGDVRPWGAPSPSPDCDAVALGSSAISDYLSTARIWTVDLPSGAKHGPVASGYGPAWSPTGKWIAYLTMTERADTTGLSGWTSKWESSIHLVRPDGTDDRVILRTPDSAQVVETKGYDLVWGKVVWSPDGRWLAFGRHSDRGVTMWVIRPDGTGLQRLTSEFLSRTAGLTPQSPTTTPARK